MDPVIPMKNSGIQVISRAAAVLRLLGDAAEGLSLGQIASRAGLPRSTVQRIVAALAVEGFVTTDRDNGGVRLGPEFRALAQRQIEDTKTALSRSLRDIAAKTGETVDLALLDGDQMLFVDQIVGSQRLRTVSSIGERFPLTSTANGKAALALLDQQDAARRIIAELDRNGVKGAQVTDLLNEIEAIRAGELATDRDDHTDGISAVGFAIRDGQGDIYAISIPVPSTRFARIKSKLDDVMTRARAALAGTYTV